MHATLLPRQPALADAAAAGIAAAWPPPPPPPPPQPRRPRRRQKRLAPPLAGPPCTAAGGRLRRGLLPATPHGSRPRWREGQGAQAAECTRPDAATRASAAAFPSPERTSRFVAVHAFAVRPLPRADRAPARGPARGAAGGRTPRALPARRARPGEGKTPGHNAPRPLPLKRNACERAAPDPLPRRPAAPPASRGGRWRGGRHRRGPGAAPWPPPPPERPAPDPGRLPPCCPRARRRSGRGRAAARRRTPLAPVQQLAFSPPHLRHSPLPQPPGRPRPTAARPGPRADRPNAWTNTRSCHAQKPGGFVSCNRTKQPHRLGLGCKGGGPPPLRGRTSRDRVGRGAPLARPESKKQEARGPLSRQASQPAIIAKARWLWAGARGTLQPLGGGVRDPPPPPPTPPHPNHRHAPAARARSQAK
jgi:hypothetical protein